MRRGVCFYCAQCGRSCKVYADFSSSSVLVIPALKTGNVDLLTNCMAREVLTNKEGFATGVSYVNKEDMQEYQVEGRTVLLAASACESARLLLNSKSSRHPNGLANSSNVVGKYLHDSTGADMGGVLPQLFDRKRYNEDELGVCMCTRHGGSTTQSLIFHAVITLNIGVEWISRHMVLVMVSKDINGKFQVHGKAKEAGGYGQIFKRRLSVFFTGLALAWPAVANQSHWKTNLCEIDPTTVDKYGIPVLRFNTKYTDYEINQAKHMKETFKEILTAMGAVILYGDDGPEKNYGLHAPGNIIHEAGTVRMGSDPKRSH
jgi:choline dehydrogenase-like flavoprotein